MPARFPATTRKAMGPSLDRQGESSYLCSRTAHLLLFAENQVFANPVSAGRTACFNPPCTGFDNAMSSRERQEAMRVSYRSTDALRTHGIHAQQMELPLANGQPTNIPLSVVQGPRAIEDEDFPFEALSDIAEIESWRKEINRPPYHIHKWWAHRLGSVFRAMVIGAFAPRGSDLIDLFYRPVRITDAVVFDPFMGSGTTVGESAKLGVRAIGRDINPVAHFLVKNALSLHDRKGILREFRAMERDVAARIRRFYRASLPDGMQVDVLYFFWVKTVDCPKCRANVDLFSSYVFARHTYPKKHPEARAVCPHCGAIRRFEVLARSMIALVVGTSSVRSK